MSIMTDVKQIGRFFVKTQDNNMKSLQSNSALFSNAIVLEIVLEADFIILEHGNCPFCYLNL